MSDKPIAFLVTVLIVGPLCSLCILGPAAVGGALAGWFGWNGDLSAVQIALLMLAVAGLIIVATKRRGVRRTANGLRSGGQLQ